MWRTLLCVVAVLYLFGSDAVARKRPRAEEAQRIAEFADKVSRQGNELRLKLKNGKQVTLKDSRPSVGACDCDGNRSVHYNFRDFIDPWYVIHMQYYEGSGVLCVNRDTGRKEEAVGSAQFSPDKTRFIASGYPGEAPCYEEIWKLSRSGLTMEWRTECGPSFRWADSKTVEAISYDCVEATLKLDGTSWTCSGSPDICGPNEAKIALGAGKHGDPASETIEPEHVEISTEMIPRDRGKPENVLPALMFAARRGQTEEMKALLDKGVEVNSRDISGWTVLQRAAEAGQLGVVRLLLKRGADVNAKTNQGSTALRSAAFNGHKEVVRVLLDSGADVNAKTSDGWTALMAAASNRHIDVVNVLLQRNADLNAKTSAGRTALMMAVEQDQAEIVNALLNKGADVNAATEEGVTALMLAAEKGRTELVQLLLEKDVSVNAKDEEGRTPLSVAAKRGHFSIAKLLRDRGAVATLPVAAELGDLDEVQRLVKKGADVNAKDDEGATALINACAQGHADVARFLLWNGADVNAENRYAWTALIVAAWKGYPEVVKVLLDYGADTRPKNDLCQTALESAQEEGHQEVVALLKAHGAK